MADERDPADAGPEPASPLSVKPRLPFAEKESGGQVAFKAAAVIYILACVIMGFLAAYMAFVQHRPLMSVAVIAPSIGALYFFIRAAMMLRPKIRG